MRIVDRKTFLSLPMGMLFSKFEPDCFEDLLIKGESWIWEHGDDFLYQSINDAVKCVSSDDFSDKLDMAREGGQSIAMDFNCTSRDGLFDADQLFAVWERADVEGLITRLQQALKDGYAN